MSQTATCATLRLFGCDCQGCCSDTLSEPPPPAPAPTATSTARPLLRGPVSASMGEWLPPNGVGGGRRSSKQGACAGSDVTRQLLWRRPEKDFAAAAATCFDASSAAACATSAAPLVGRRLRLRPRVPIHSRTVCEQVCKDYCAAEPSCGAIETVQRMGGSEYDCHSIDVYSNMPGPAASVTHVVTATAEHTLRRTVALALTLTLPLTPGASPRPPHLSAQARVRGGPKPAAKDPAPARSGACTFTAVAVA